MNDSLLAKFFRFLKRPDYYSNVPKRKFLGKLFDFLRLYALLYAFAILCGLLISLVTTLIPYDLDQNAVVDLISNAPMLYVFFMAVIAAPLTEELTFRLILRFSYRKLAISLFFILLILFTDSIVTSITSLGDPVLFPLLIGGIGVFSIFTAFIMERLVDKTKVERFYEKHIGKLFYLSVLTFALVHVNNYSNLGPALILLVPILVLPQFFAGLFFGYIRINYGFWWAIFLHAAYNFLTLAPFIFFSFGSEKLQNILTSEVSMQSSQFTNTDTLILLGVTIGALFIFVLFVTLILHLIIEFFLKRNSLK